MIPSVGFRFDWTHITAIVLYIVLIVILAARPQGAATHWVNTKNLQYDICLYSWHSCYHDPFLSVPCSMSFHSYSWSARNWDELRIYSYLISKDTSMLSWLIHGNAQHRICWITLNPAISAMDLMHARRYWPALLEKQFMHGGWLFGCLNSCRYNAGWCLVSNWSLHWQLIFSFTCLFRWLGCLDVTLSFCTLIKNLPICRKTLKKVKNPITPSHSKILYSHNVHFVFHLFWFVIHVKRGKKEKKGGR